MTATRGRLTLLRTLARGETSRDTRDRFRDAQLRGLVAHAAAHVPYYQRLFRRYGLRPADVRTVADLERIPLVSRAELQRADPREVIADTHPVGRLIVHRTSGSTGRPLAIHRTWLEERTYSLLRYRALRRLGVRAKDRLVYVGLVRARHERNWQMAQRLVRRLGLFRRLELDALLPAERIEALLDALRPDVVIGYPGVLSRVAACRGVSRGPLRPRLVVTGGEVLTSSMRRQITDGFGAPVLETYACYEAPALAWQCAETGVFHLGDESGILEIITADGRAARPGESGEVVVTPLHSFAMPFIRYRLGDVASQGENRCRCGADRATIERIQGRMLDYFPLANGRTVHPYALTTPVIESAPWLAQYQLTQERPDHLVMRVVPRTPPRPEELRHAQALMLAAAGPGITLEFRIMPEIPPERNGKFRVSRSLVASAYDDTGPSGDCPGVGRSTAR